MVYEEPKKMLLYGDACRVSTDPIAKASYFFDLIQISYADTDPIYTIENYPNFFRVVPSENALSLARIPFIRHFNWTRVGTIYQNLPRYSLPHSKLLTDLERYNIVIKQSVSLPGSVDGLQNRDLGDELRKLKEKDVRIILGNFDEEWGLLLFCEAFRERMTGRKYQWILTGMNADKLWQFARTKNSSCTEQELLVAMDGYITTDITPVTRSQHRTISGMMAHEYSNEYKRRAHEMSISIEENKFYGYVYDGIWAIALALNRVDQQLRYYQQLARSGRVQLLPEMESLNSLLDFDYHKPIWVKLIRNALNKTRFDGVTGTVSFVKNERPGLISFSQFQAFRDTTEVIIGSYDALNDNLDLKVGFPIFWRGPSPPIDYTIERVTPFRINRTLFVIVSILALFGIVLAFIFLFINIKFRDQRYIKMSSPYLNNLIIIGCILTYTSVIILGLDSGLTSEYNFPYICNARAWVLMAGFTLAFGSMFSKTFRVHSIFTNIKLHKKVIKDYKLFMVVFILLTFDVCILIVWQYFDPFYRETNNGTSIQDSDNEDIIIVPEMEHCQSKRMTIFLSVIYVYKGLLMAFGCFLAWETRHVSIPALNDSKYIGLSVYNVVIMCVIGAGLSFVLRDQQDASFVIISIFIIFCSTTTLCLVFVPKLIELKQNPKAGDHRVRATLKTFKKNYQEEALGAAAGCRDIHGNLIGRGHGVNLGERIKLLQDENVKNRGVLKEKTYELEALTYKYRKIQSMIQSGQYFQALSATIGAGQTPNPMPSSSITTNLQTSAMLTSRSPTQDRTSFAKGGNLDLPRKYVQLQSDNKQGDGRSKSPLMFSSTTQITTTNTTSSTNNHTDLTTDYSSRITNSGETSNSLKVSSPVDGSKQQALVVAIDLGLKDEALSKEADDLLDNFTDGVGVKKQRTNYAKNLITSRKKPIDSSYCSMMGAGELGNALESPHDDDVFTVFSYAAHKGADGKSQRAIEVAEDDFNRWSEGPFCTLMVRNQPQYQCRMRQGKKLPVAPGKAVLKTNLNLQQPNATSKISDNSRSSCPNIETACLARRNRPRKQLSQQADPYSAQQRPVPATAGAKLARLPRTISMIEYLGLDEFDLIARRHDRILRHNKSRQVTTACCYGGITPPLTDCIYCAVGHVQQDTKQKSLLTQSNGDMASEPLTSGELMQSSSRLSCSTCCSLASRSYVSHSDIFDGSSSHTSTSSGESAISGFSATGSLRNPRCLSQSQIGSLRSGSSTSSSTVDGLSLNAHHDSTMHGTNTCKHHHMHHQHQLSCPISSPASSNSSPFPMTSHKATTNNENDSCDRHEKLDRSNINEAQTNVDVTISSDTPVAGTSSAGTGMEDSKTTNNDDEQKFSIKCDVLENL